MKCMKVVDKIVEGYMNCKLANKQIDSVEITYQKNREPKVKIKVS